MHQERGIKVLHKQKQKIFIDLFFIISVVLGVNTTTLMRMINVNPFVVQAQYSSEDCYLQCETEMMLNIKNILEVRIPEAKD